MIIGSSRRATLLPLFLLLTGCPAEESGRHRTLVVAAVGDALTLDPAAITDSESAQVALQIFEGLVRFKEGTAEVEPALATRWSVDQGGTRWTFHLRQGVRFHDGTPLDADAVVFSFERQRDPAHPYHFQDFTYWESTFRNIREVRAVDRHTVQIHIQRAFAPFLANLALFPASVVSPAAMRRLGHGFAAKPVGTGPFRFARWKRGERITLERNPLHWESPPALQHLVFEAIPSARERLISLQGGAVDLALNLAPVDRQIVQLHSELALIRVPSNNVAYLALNTQRPPFDDLRVRRAVNHAVDKHAIAKLAYQGLAVPAQGPIPPVTWSYHPGTTRYAHDPGKARALLAEAGYDPALRPRFFVMNTSRPYLHAPVLIGRMIQRYLAEVGMQVELVIHPFKEHSRATQQGEHDLCLAGWAGDTGDPDNFLYVLLDRDNARRGAARNLAMFTNESLHILLAAARATHDRSVRERYYRRAQEIVADQAPWVPLAHTDIVVGARRDLDRLRAQPSPLFSFHRVTRQ